MTIPTKPNPVLVPNEFPRYKTLPYRLAIIGEAPGAAEEYHHRPFCAEGTPTNPLSGASGRLLWAEAAKVGILRDACLVGNVCQLRPPQNRIEEFDYNGPEIQSGITQLTQDIATFAPNLILCLGATALRWAKGYPESIRNWRGSLFRSPAGYKCLASLHPAAVLRVYEWKTDLAHDLRVARKEAETPVLSLPERTLDTDLTTDEILTRFDEIRTNQRTISLDIEGYVYNMWCFSIATSPSSSFYIRFPTDDRRLWRATAGLLADPGVPKILQNGCYDAVVLQFGHSLPVRGIVDDTMLMHWELFCEKPKSLAYQASIYTRQPYWKDDREHDDPTIRAEYCCLDSAVTFEIRDKVLPFLQAAQDSYTNYRFNMAVQEPLLYMQMHGMAYDSPLAAKMLSATTQSIARLQWTLDSIAYGPKRPSHAEWVVKARDSLCYVRSASQVISPSTIVPHAKTTRLHEALKVQDILCSRPVLSIADHGELATLTESSLNVDSSDQIANFLYRCLKLPIQYKKEGGRKTTKETTDVGALLTLYSKTSDPTLKLILTLRGLRTRTESLGAKTDIDGRIRCSYNQLKKIQKTGGSDSAGGITSTGRLSCSKFLTGSGYNLQTTTRKQRCLFLADEGYWLGQCDLSGADGWTVAAHCNAAGDSTMLEDYRFGLKPANIIALMHAGHQVNRMPRDQIKAKAKLVDKDGWLYFTCKRVQHGSNYGMKARTMAEQILKDSYKLFGEPVVVPESVCTTLQLLYFQRYPGIKSWHARIKSQLKANGYLISASGHKRIFFGRHDDYDTFKEACAEEPQNNTTYATNLALLKCWTDPDNCISEEATTDSGDSNQPSRRTTLRIQPLHQVHDAFIFQFKKNDVDFAKRKVPEYFNNTLRIAGQPITIPYEGAYGRSWGELTEGKI